MHVLYRYNGRMRVKGVLYRTVWMEGGVVRLIDQRRLPHAFTILDCPSCASTAEAISHMTVRGAGAIGAAAGFAMAQGALEAPEIGFMDAIARAAVRIRATRPTARDLFHAVEQVEAAIRAAGGPATARIAARAAAQRWADENAAAGHRIGDAGEPLIPPQGRILTQCNAGWLAFVDWGSALAPVYAAQRAGKQPFVYVPETRPRGQGSKLTAWELGQDGIAHALIADTVPGSLLARREIDLVIVGADRIAANGDTANKIGTYQLAVLAQHHGVAFYVAAPRSTFDAATSTGAGIVIEERSEDEVAWVEGRSADGSSQRVRICPDGTPVRNPAFDVTPAALITGFITDAGLIPAQPDAVGRLAAAPAA